MAGLYTQHHEGNDAYRYAIYNDRLAEQVEDRNSYRRPIVERKFVPALRANHQKDRAKEF